MDEGATKNESEKIEAADVGTFLLISSFLFPLWTKAILH